MTILGVNHTGVSVSDMEQSLLFYRDLLGLEVILDSDVPVNDKLSRVVGMNDAQGRVVWLRAGQSMIELWQWQRPVGRDLPADYCPADRGVTHFGLATDDVDELSRRVLAAGFKVNTSPEDLGLHKTTYIRGPDEEIIEILEDRANDEWLQQLNEASLSARAMRDQ